MDLAGFNKKLLSKWKWSLGNKDKGLWRDILVSKYESWRILDSNRYNVKGSN